VKYEANVRRSDSSSKTITWSKHSRRILVFIRGLIVSRAKLSLELLALRQQLVVLRRTVQRPQIQNRDRWFWIVVSRIWKDWRQALVFVKPDTVIKWHRQGFRMYWRWKSRSQVGRPKLDKEIRDLIRRISDENPLWGVPRLQSELRLLGYEVAESTVDKYRVRNSKPPSQTWKTFLENHAGEIASIDFFTVPTITFRILFCFVVLRAGPISAAERSVMPGGRNAWKITWSCFAAITISSGLTGR
jgi:hypothetical protein